jgi:hypothetical protein
VSLWRKKKSCDKLAPIVVANEHNILTYPLDILHDLSIKSDDLSIKSWVGLTDEDFYGQSELQRLAMKYAEAKLKEKNT